MKIRPQPGDGVRILLLLAHPGIDGPLPKLGPFLLRGLRDLGCAVDVAYWSRHREHESLLEKIGGRLSDLARVRMMARAAEYDCLLVTTTHDWPAIIRDIPLLLATRRHCQLRILHFHGSLSDELTGPGRWQLKAASRVLVAMASGLFVLSREERREWRRFSPHTPVWLVRNPYERQDGQTSPCHDVDLSREPFKFLYVGRLRADKGLRELVAAFAQVTATLDAELHIAGRGPYASWLAARALELAGNSRIVMHGYLDNLGLNGLYATCDALVLPSYREGFPTVFLEAMDFGLPIVTTAIRGALDSLRPEENALLVPVRSVEPLAEAMLRVARDSGLRARMSVRNRAMIDGFAPDRVASEYVAGIVALAAVVGRPMKAPEPASSA